MTVPSSRDRAPFSDYLENRLGAKTLAIPEAHAARAKELEQLADQGFGLATQQVFYDELLERPDIVVDLFTQGGPSVRPPEHLVRWPSESDVPPSLVAFLRPFESRPTWQLATRLYREHRRSSAARPQPL